jgi:hypothetical protein
MRALFALSLMLAACGSSADESAAESAGQTPDGTGGNVPGAGGTRADAGTAGTGGKVHSGGSTGSGGKVQGGGSTGSGGGASGGSTGGGGSTASGGSTGSGGTVFVPPECGADAGAPWPSTAPALTPGVWKDIGPIPNYYGNGIVFDACNPAILYTAGGNYAAAGGPGDKHGVFRSTDAGTTWEQLVNLDSSARVRVDPRNSLHLYVVDGVNGKTNGFWRSLDGGKTWAIPDGFKTAADSVHLYDAYDVTPDPADFNHVLVTFHNPWQGTVDGASGIFESFDGGDSFTIHQPDPGWAWAYGYDVFFLYEPTLGLGDSKTWLFGTQGKGYWRTTNSGQSWTQVTTNNMQHGGGQIYYTASGVLYASGSPDVMRSTNNGVTWTTLTPHPFTGYFAIMGDGTNLYTGGASGGPFYTAKESADTTWTDYSQQTFKSGPYEMAFDARHGILYSGNAAGGLWALKVR